MVRVANLKNNLSRHLAHVRRGREIIVFDRDTPIARIVPFVPGDTTGGRTSSQDTAAAAGRVAELVRQGVLSAGDTKALAGWVETHQPARRPTGSPSAVDALLEMRRESRR